MDTIYEIKDGNIFDSVGSDLIVITPSEEALVQHKDLLDGVVKAMGFSDKKIRYISGHGPYQMRGQQAVALVSFGLHPAMLFANTHFHLNKCHYLETGPVICTYPLDELQNDVRKKTELWSAIKELIKYYES